ncbi:hypothetical protein [Cellulomonas endometrii]|uniref:hypothetical protein n=1 Tax=Cellulomonas endometrii TaxID=3036301 RepID=UPI0024ADE50B|nr:hypothetical protein [Cellulomonas endometrii]
MNANPGDQVVTAPALTSANTTPSGYAVRGARLSRAGTSERFLDLVGAILGAKASYEVRGASAATTARDLRRIAEDAAYLAADLDSTEAVR